MIISRSHFTFASLMSVLLGTAIIPIDLNAQTAPAGTAHVRFWKTAIPTVAHVRVSFKTAAGKHSSAYDLGSAGPGFLFDNYTDVLSGQGTLEVYVGPNKTPATTLPAEFASGEFATVLMKEPRKAGEPPQLEVIQDGPGEQPDDSTPAQIRVRNFVADIKDIRVTLGDALNAQFTGSGSYLLMRGLKPAVYPVKTVGTGTDGKPFEWTTEADLRQHRNQTLLIFPDPYGRVRPRLSVDGEALAAPAPANDERR